MATDAIITLERLRCIRESDGTGHSEPYIWPTLLSIDDNTLATPLLVGVTAPALGNARVVIKNDMRAGQTADIPASVGVLRVRFEDGLAIRRLILAVALWEGTKLPRPLCAPGSRHSPASYALPWPTTSSPSARLVKRKQTRSSRPSRPASVVESGRR